MKTRSLSSKFAAAAVAIGITSTALIADTITFDASRDPLDYASNIKERGSFISMIEEDGEGLLRFASTGGAELILIEKDGAPAKPGDAVEIELRSSGEATFGVFLRGGYLDDLAYMAFYSPTEDGTIRLNLDKTNIESAQRPGQGSIAHKNTKGVFISGEWIVLRFEVVGSTDGGVNLRASIREKDSDIPILETEGYDADDTIASGGTLAMRFFSKRTDDENTIDIRSINLNANSEE